MCATILAGCNAINSDCTPHTVPLDGSTTAGSTSASGASSSGDTPTSAIGTAEPPTTAVSSETTAVADSCSDGEIDTAEFCDTAASLGQEAAYCEDCERAVHAVDLAAGTHHMCVLLSNGKVRCCGDGSAGQLGGGPLFDVEGIDATEGTIDFTKSVAGDINGRVFAGGRHSCVSRAGATATWCWGLAYPEPTKTVYPYHEVAPSDDNPEHIGNYILCGLYYDAIEDMKAIRCWGNVEESLDYQPFYNSAQCVDRVDEDSAGTRIFYGTADESLPSHLEAGVDHACVPTVSNMICVGRDFELCEESDGCMASIDGCSDSTKCCPDACIVSGGCSHGGPLISIWRERTCYVYNDSLDCYHPVDAPDFPSRSLTANCGEGFKASSIVTTENYVCVIGNEGGTDGRVCCIAHDGSPKGLVPFSQDPTIVVKGAANEDGALLLDEDGLVWRVHEAGPTWSVSVAFPPCGPA